MRRHEFALIRICLFLAALICLPICGAAQSPRSAVKQVAEIKDPENGADDQFGFSVAMNSDTLVVGAPQFFGPTGTAYVFVNTGGAWNEAARLTSGNSRSIEFGTSVAIGKNVIAIGAPDDNNSSGVVYLFVKPLGGWNGDMTPTAQLSVTDGTGQNLLGASLVISADDTTIAAGAPGEGGLDAIYVFVEPAGGWVTMTQSTAGLSSPQGYEIGISLAMSGDTIVAGEIGTTGLQAAFVFVRPKSGWGGSILPAATLSASDGHTIDHFGHSVAISGNTVLVGAPLHPSGKPGAGYMYVEPVTGWADMTQTAELSVPVKYNLVFGQAMALIGNVVLAGAPGDSIGHSSEQGAVFGFLKPVGGWENGLTPTGAATASDGQAGELFGDSIAVSGKNVAVGAPGYSKDIGAVYIFSLQ